MTVLRRIFKNIHEIPRLQLGKPLSLEFHENSRIFKRPIPASYFKKIQAVEILWIFKNIQAYKSWKFLEIPSSIFLEGQGPGLINAWTCGQNLLDQRQAESQP